MTCYCGGQPKPGTIVARLRERQKRAKRIDEKLQEEAEQQFCFAVKALGREFVDQQITEAQFIAGVADLVNKFAAYPQVTREADDWIATFKEQLQHRLERLKQLEEIRLRANKPWPDCFRPPPAKLPPEREAARKAWAGLFNLGGDE